MRRAATRLPGVEHVLLDQKHGRCWKLNPTAGLVVNTRRNGGSEQDAVAEVVEKFDVDRERGGSGAPTKRSWLTPPFAAHAWIEVDDQLIRENAGTHQLRRLMVIPPVEQP